MLPLEDVRHRRVWENWAVEHNGPHEHTIITKRIHLLVLHASLLVNIIVIFSRGVSTEAESSGGDFTGKTKV